MMVNHWKLCWASYIKHLGVLCLRIWICWFSYGGTCHEDLRHSLSSNQWKNGVVYCSLSSNKAAYNGHVQVQVAQ